MTGFLGLVFLYLWFVVDTRLIYHTFGQALYYPAFFTDKAFFKETVNQPGGLTEYISAFASHCYYIAWKGALVITFVVLLMCIGLKKIANMFGAKRLNFILCLPAAATLYITNSYDHALNVLLALTAAIWMAVLWAKVNCRNGLWRCVLFSFYFVILYYIAGAASLLFTVIACLWEFANKRGLLVIFYAVISFICIIVTGITVSDLRYAEAFTLLLPVGDNKLSFYSQIAGLCCYVLILLPGLYAGLRRITGKSNADSLPKKPHTILQAIMLLIITVLAAILSYNGEKKTLLEIDYLARNEKWAQVLAKADQLPEGFYNIYVNHDINRALYYTGQLNEKMFAYLQKTPALLLSFGEGERTTGTLYVKRMAIFLALGDIGTAERLAYEMLEVSGDNPYIIQQLAYINKIKGHQEIADVYLRAVNKNPVCKNKMPDLITDGSNTPVAPPKDSVYRGFKPETFFNELLETNKHNKMAFEYMMAFYLLTRQTDKIAQNIYRLDDFGYEKLPRLYEEALVIYMGPEGKRIDFPVKWRPDEKAIERAKQFDRIESGFKPERRAHAIAALRPEFGNSYYFYYVFDLAAPKK